MLFQVLKVFRSSRNDWSLFIIWRRCFQFSWSSSQWESLMMSEGRWEPQWCPAAERRMRSPGFGLCWHYHKYFRLFKLNFFLNYFQFGQLWSKYLSVDIPWQDSVWSGARFSCQDGSRCILHHFVMVIKERLTLKGIISPHINKTVFFPLIPSHLLRNIRELVETINMLVQYSRQWAVPGEEVWSVPLLVVVCWHGVLPLVHLDWLPAGGPTETQHSLEVIPKPEENTLL